MQIVSLADNLHEISNPILLSVNKFVIITQILFDLERPTSDTLACLGWFPTRVQNCVCPSTKKTKSEYNIK